MNRIVGTWTALAIAALATGSVAVPIVSLAEEQQPPASCQGCGQRAVAGGRRMFDPKSVTTLQGDVESVQTGGGRRGQGVFLTLATGSEKLQVVVGPSFYLEQQPMKLAQGDKVEVKGSRTTWSGRPVMIAQEIRKGDQVMILRDAEGVPQWSPRGHP